MSDGLVMLYTFLCAEMSMGIERTKLLIFILLSRFIL